MAMITPHDQRQGFALLVAVVFMSVMLTFGLALGSLAYKQETLAIASVDAQYAFYAADTALECALYQDQRQDAYDYKAYNRNLQPSLLTCDNATATRRSYSYTTGSSGALVLTDRIQLSGRCADVTIYKYSGPQSPDNVTTYIFSQGYNVACSDIGSKGVRAVARGIRIHY